VIKLVMLIHRKAGMGDDDFRTYWRDVHGPIARKMPNIRKYVQNHATASMDGSSPSYDGFAEVWYDDLQAMRESFASSEGEVATADAGKFIDMDRMVSFIVEEVDMI
jgi:uncharacterized protein (TIGR02118 family)